MGNRSQYLFFEWFSTRLPFTTTKSHNKIIRKALENKGVATILDLGCGRGSFKVFRDYDSTGFDIYQPYLEKAKENGNYKRFIVGDVRDLSGIADQSYDAVVCSEVIEHLEVAEGWQLIKDMERIARKVVVVFTPWGMYILPQCWDANPTMIHKSGWHPDVFRKRGYRIIPSASLRWRRTDAFVLVLFDYFLNIIGYPLIHYFPERWCNDYAAVKSF